MSEYYVRTTNNKLTDLPDNYVSAAKHVVNAALGDCDFNDDCALGVINNPGILNSFKNFSLKKTDVLRDELALRVLICCFERSKITFKDPFWDIQRKVYVEFQKLNDTLEDKV